MEFKQSPIAQICMNFDVQHLDQFTDFYYGTAINSRPEFWNEMLLKEFEWRFKHKLNIVFSIEGEQGSGKSKIGLYLCCLISKIFQKDFSINNVCFTIEDLNEKISKSVEKETFLLDEQRITKVGIMSLMVQQNLIDYEEQLRISQNNLGYCSPELREHSHFFVFKTYPHIERDEEGYPKFFTALFSTKRHYDNQLMPRGLMTFPMINKEFNEQYEKKKLEHINNLKNRHYTTFTSLEMDVNDITKKYGKTLIKFLATGKKIPIEKKSLMILIYKELGTGKYTVQGYEFLAELLKQKVREMILEEKV